MFPRDGQDNSAYFRKLSDIKHSALDADDAFDARADDIHDIAILLRQSGPRKKIGVFSLKSRQAETAVPAPDGNYQNLIDGRDVPVRDGKLFCDGRPVIFTFTEIPHEK